jgi:arsenate reductase (thioredoxin)
MKILIVCTGNSCRSPMAVGFLRSFDPRLEIVSAGTQPELQVNPTAVMVMKEALIDLSTHKPQSVDKFASLKFNLIISIGEQARLRCQQFNDAGYQCIHLDIADPANAVGSPDSIISTYRESRDEIKNTMFRIYINHIKPLLK